MSRFCLLLPIVMILGCGSSGKGPDAVSVSGTVTLDGEPLAGAEVHFLSKDLASFGKTDSEGRFELVQGAVPGENTVYISKVKGSKLLKGYSDDPEEGLDEGQLEATTDEGVVGAQRQAGETLPPEYSDPEKTKLTWKVPEGGTSKADFKLFSGKKK